LGNASVVEINEHQTNRSNVHHNTATVVDPVSLTPSHDESMLSRTSSQEGMYYMINQSNVYST
jgi:hypothetical protein